MATTKSILPAQAQVHFDRYFEKIHAKAPSRPLQARVVSRKLNLDYSYPAGSTDRPFHIASIGKMFTATLIFRLIEQSRLSLHAPISDFFPPQELEGLFVYRNQDYSAQVTVAQLLGHMSGINDYFEGKSTAKTSFLKQVLNQPDTRWTPERLVDFTRRHQTAVAQPGSRFLYSDTGYILLGMLIEKLTAKSFDQNLADDIFTPLDMRDSNLMFYSEPANGSREIENIWVNGVEVSRFQSLTCDWSGGGIISTPADLLKFNHALRDGQLVSAGSLAAMDSPAHRFRPGIHYGLGMMEIRFKEFFFLLGNLPRPKGHIGILATHLFYDPVHDAHIVLNFGDTARMVASFQALIEIETTLAKIRRLN